MSRRKMFSKILGISLVCLILGPMLGTIDAAAATDVRHYPGLAQASNAPAITQLQDIDSGLTSPTGNYRWRDVSDQLYSENYQTGYNYTQANVEVSYDNVGNTLQGTLIATNLKPNFAYQLKLVGTPGTPTSERIGLAGRWWQEEWDGSEWNNGQNLNNKGDGYSPNPNDNTYFARCGIADPTSPTGLKYRYTGYLVFDYFITDADGNAILAFETNSSYHVLWKTSQRARSGNDGPLKESTFDPDPSSYAYDIDYGQSTVSIFGEWERLPMNGVYLQPGDYTCQMILTEESFHGSGGAFAGNWAAAMGGDIQFNVTAPVVTNVTASQTSTSVDIGYDVSDGEQSDVDISFEFWDGSAWQACATATGEGTQSVGTGKSGTWDAKTDFDEHYMSGSCKIRVTADDGQAENNTDTEESNTFTLDTKGPTGYGCSTPADDATDVSVDPTLTCLTASDDSTPISYYFQIAEDDTFSTGLEESDWQSGTTWAPSTLDYSMQYFWRVRAGDSYGNESGYGTAFDFTTEEAPDTDPPEVISTMPVKGATSVAVDATVSATFSENIQPGTNFGDITISGATGVTPGIVGNTLTIAHDDFAPDTTYMVTIPAGAVNDMAANPLASDYTWSFYTVIPPTLGLIKGVNIIAYTGATTSLPGALTNVGPGGLDVVDGLWARGIWTGSEWLYYNARIPFGTLSQLENGRGYIIVVTEDCTWELPLVLTNLHSTEYNCDGVQ